MDTTIKPKKKGPGRPPVIFPGHTYGIFKIIKRIEGNLFVVQCTQCETVFERHLRSLAEAAQTKKCYNCSNTYNKRLYQRWKHFMDNVPKREIDPVFQTYKGWETWVLTQSNYSEDDNLVYFYRISPLHKYSPTNCAFAHTKVNLRHNMEEVYRMPSHLINYQLKDIEENGDEYLEY